MAVRIRGAKRLLAGLALLFFPAASLAAALPERSGADHEILLRSRSITPPEDRSALQTLSALPRPRSHVIVQFYEIPSEAERIDLDRSGVRLLGYLPRRAYLASVPRSLRASDPVLARVRWIGPLEPEDRIAASLRQSAVSAPRRPLDLDVRPFDDEDVPAVASRLSSAGFEVLGLTGAGKGIRLRAAPGELRRIAFDDAIRWVGPAPPRFAMHNDLTRENIKADAVQAPPDSLCGAGIDIGIWDGACVQPHDDFGSRLITAETLCATVPIGDRQHATHVAGTMAGDGSHSEASGGTPAQWKGVAPCANIVSYDFYDDTIAETAGAIADSQNSIELSQNSWGFALNPADPGACDCTCLGLYESFCADYDDVVRGSQGKKIVVVFSAGNDRNNGVCGFSISPPYVNYTSMVPLGTAKNVITVGGTYSEDDGMTDFSSWGPTADGRIKPDVTAPAVGRDATKHVKSTVPGNTYVSFGGTSMSAPAGSGSAALLWEQYRVSYGPEPLPSTIKALLIHTAHDLDTASSFLNTGPDFASGYGEIDVKAAVDRVIGRAVAEGTLANGQTDVLNLDIITGDAGVRATLVWDDPKGLENAAQELVNDLDLVVLDPDGTQHHPWTLDPTHPSDAAIQTAEDHVNNVEQVWVPAPYTPGTWSFRVFANSVPVGPQFYSLVVTPDAGFVPFGPIEPAAGTVFQPDDPPASFVWAPGALQSFKVEWADTPGFNVKVKNSGKSFLSDTSFTPASQVWLKILKLGFRSGTIYWRVIGKDEKGALTTSTTQTCVLAAAEPAAFTAPADGASFAATDPPAQFTWDANGSSSFKITFSARSDLGKPHKTSGDSWLNSTSWTPTASLWGHILDLADAGDGQTVYYRITGKDRLGRVTTGAVRTLLVLP